MLSSESQSEDTQDKAVKRKFQYRKKRLENLALEMIKKDRPVDYSDSLLKKIFGRKKFNYLQNAFLALKNKGLYRRQIHNNEGKLELLTAIESAFRTGKIEAHSFLIQFTIGDNVINKNPTKANCVLALIYQNPNFSSEIRLRALLDLARIYLNGDEDAEELQNTHLRFANICFREAYKTARYWKLLEDSLENISSGIVSSYNRLILLNSAFKAEAQAWCHDMDIQISEQAGTLGHFYGSISEFHPGFSERRRLFLSLIAQCNNTAPKANAPLESEFKKQVKRLLQPEQPRANKKIADLFLRLWFDPLNIKLIAKLAGAVQTEYEETESEYWRPVAQKLWGLIASHFRLIQADLHPPIFLSAIEHLLSDEAEEHSQEKIAKRLLNLFCFGNPDQIALAIRKLSNPGGNPFILLLFNTVLGGNPMMNVQVWGTHEQVMTAIKAILVSNNPIAFSLANILFKKGYIHLREEDSAAKSELCLLQGIVHLMGGFGITQDVIKALECFELSLQYSLQGNLLRRPTFSLAIGFLQAMFSPEVEQTPEQFHELIAELLNYTGHAQEWKAEARRLEQLRLSLESALSKCQSYISQCFYNDSVAFRNLQQFYHHEFSHESLPDLIESISLRKEKSQQLALSRKTAENNLVTPPMEIFISNAWETTAAIYESEILTIANPGHDEPARMREEMSDEEPLLMPQHRSTTGIAEEWSDEEPILMSHHSRAERRQDFDDSEDTGWIVPTQHSLSNGPLMNSSTLARALNDMKVIIYGAIKGQRKFLLKLQDEGGGFGQVLDLLQDQADEVHQLKRDFLACIHEFDHELEETAEEEARLELQSNYFLVLVRIKNQLILLARKQLREQYIRLQELHQVEVNRQTLEHKFSEAEKKLALLSLNSGGDTKRKQDVEDGELTIDLQPALARSRRSGPKTSTEFSPLLGEDEDSSSSYTTDSIQVHIPLPTDGEFLSSEQVDDYFDFREEMGRPEDTKYKRMMVEHYERFEALTDENQIDPRLQRYTFCFTQEHAGFSGFAVPFSAKDEMESLYANISTPIQPPDRKQLMRNKSQTAYKIFGALGGVITGATLSMGGVLYSMSGDLATALGAERIGEIFLSWSGNKFISNITETMAMTTNANIDLLGIVKTNLTLGALGLGICCIAVGGQIGWTIAHQKTHLPFAQCIARADSHTEQQGIPYRVHLAGHDFVVRHVEKPVASLLNGSGLFKRRSVPETPVGSPHQEAVQGKRGKMEAGVGSGANARLGLALTSDLMVHGNSAIFHPAQPSQRLLELQKAAKKMGKAFSNFLAKIPTNSH